MRAQALLLAVLVTAGPVAASTPPPGVDVVCILPLCLEWVVLSLVWTVLGVAQCGTPGGPCALSPPPENSTEVRYVTGLPDPLWGTLVCGHETTDPLTGEHLGAWGSCDHLWVADASRFYIHGYDDLGLPVGYTYAGWDGCFVWGHGAGTTLVVEAEQCGRTSLSVWVHGPALPGHIVIEQA